MNLKKIFIEIIGNICSNEKEIAVALSGGKDSTIILFALLELNIKPIAYTFHIENILSDDFLTAKRNCQDLNIEFHECIISSKVNIELLKKYILTYHRIKKVEVEAYYPYYFLLPKVQQKILLIGMMAGNCVPLSKKICIHYKNNLSKLNQWRDEDFIKSKRDLEVLSDMALQYNIQLKDPFYNRDLLNWFKQQEWNDLHKPHQKQVFINMFPDYFAKIKTMRQCSLQCGNSGIREIFQALLSTDLNYKHRVRTQELYKDIYDKFKYTKLI
jgi:hypothetical protein